MFLTIIVHRRQLIALALTTTSQEGSESASHAALYLYVVLINRFSIADLRCALSALNSQVHLYHYLLLVLSQLQSLCVLAQQEQEQEEDNKTTSIYVGISTESARSIQPHKDSSQTIRR